MKIFTNYSFLFVVHHQARSKKRKGYNNHQDHESSTSEEDMDDDLEEEDENKEQFNSFQDPCPKNFQQDQKSPDTQYIPPCTPADTSWTSPSSSSNDSGIASCDPLLSTLTNSNKFEQVQSSSTTTTTQQQLQNQLNNKVATLNNNNDDIMKEFTDFVDLVDSLHGMPDIDFEDNFEMFPIH